MVEKHLLHAGGSNHNFALIFDKEANSESAELNGEMEARKIFTAFWENLPGNTFDWLKRYFKELDEENRGYDIIPFNWMREKKSWEMY